MSMKFKSWVMDQYENFDEAVQRSADYVHSKLTDNSLEIADLKAEVRWDIHDELYYEEITKLNGDLLFEHQYEQQREGACGVFEGSTPKEIQEELFDRVKGDSDFVDPYKEDPELSDKIWDIVEYRLNQIDWNKLYLKKRGEKRKIKRWRKRVTEYGY